MEHTLKIFGCLFDSQILWVSCIHICWIGQCYLNARLNQILHQLIRISPRKQRALTGGSQRNWIRVPTQCQASHFHSLEFGFITCGLRGIGLPTFKVLSSFTCLGDLFLAFSLLFGSVKGISLTFFLVFNLWEKQINHVKFREVFLNYELSSLKMALTSENSFVPDYFLR